LEKWCNQKSKSLFQKVWFIALSEIRSAELKYKEFQKGKPIEINFKKICSYSSCTIEAQKTKKKGISIVACFSDKDKKQIRNDIVSKIQDLEPIPKIDRNIARSFLIISDNV
jgi:hypothetical protein